MNQDVKSQFLSLAEDLHVYILTFLSYRDILRCASVCADLRQTYLSSSELQYIVELGGQQLLSVDLRVDNHTPISERLQLLRDEARAWFKFDTQPVETIVVPERFYTANTFVSNGHLCLCDAEGLSGFAKIFPILPDPSQQAIDREWSPELLFSVPNARNINVLMDPEQNLISAAYDIINGSGVYIDLLVLDGDGVHPKAAGPTLIMSPGLPRRQITDIEEDIDDDLKTETWRLESLGNHFAIRHQLELNDPIRLLWWLQIWDWQYSTTSNCILSDTTLTNDIDFCFLGNNRLLIVDGNLKVYSIENMSQPPQLLACFLFPTPVESLICIPSKDGLAHGSQPGIQAQKTMWTSDPTHRLLFLVKGPPLVQFVISTSIFFELDFFEGTATTIPWKHWGPLNSRLFQGDFDDRSGFAICGSRVLQAVPTVKPTNDDPMEYRIHMRDFSPLAVEHRQGLGRVVREPSTIDLEGELVTTSLPYVEIISDMKSILNNPMIVVWVDRDRIYVPHPDTKRLEVIKVLGGSLSS